MNLNLSYKLKLGALTLLETLEAVISRWPAPLKKVARPMYQNEFIQRKIKYLQKSSHDQKMKKEVYGHKGSAYKGKGNVNTDTETFNHPRKEVPHGRQH